MSNKLIRISVFLILGLAVVWGVLNKDSINPEDIQASIEDRKSVV